MAQGWNVDIAGAEAVVRRAAQAGTTMQAAALDVDSAMRAVVASLSGTDASTAAQSFRTSRQGDAPAAVRGVVDAVTAATGAANAFATADSEMADRVAAATRHGDGVPGAEPR